MKVRKKMNTITLDSKKMVYSTILAMGNVTRLYCLYYDDIMVVYSANNYNIRIVEDKKEYNVTYHNYENDTHVLFTWNNISKLLSYYHEKSMKYENVIKNLKIDISHADENIQYYMQLCDDLRDRINIYRDDIDNKNAIIDSQESTVWQLDNMVNDKIAECYKLQNQVKRLDSALSESYNIIDIYKNRMVECENGKNAYIKRMSKKYRDKRMKIIELNTKIEQLQEFNDELQKKLYQYRNVYGLL